MQEKNQIGSILIRIKRKVELNKIKKKIKKIENIEAFENAEKELISLGIIDENFIDNLKKKRKKKKLYNQSSFEKRVRADQETINRIILIGRSFKEEQKKREEKELDLNRDERTGRNKVKNLDERTKSGGKGKQRERDIFR